MKVLDKGFVELKLHMGGDMLVVNAARNSFGNEDWFKDAADAGDEKLINYLARHRHVSPFYHPQMTYLVKLPISTHRQWVKHRIGTAENSQSSRYTKMKEEVYFPEYYRVQSKSNKQGSEGRLEGKAWINKSVDRVRFTEPEENQKWFFDEFDISEGIALMNAMALAPVFEAYDQMLALGVAKEMARDILPLGLYTSMVWTSSLMAFWHFLELREDTHAQYEIRSYAHAMHEQAKQFYPISLEALARYGTAQSSA
jgi:thymidylate synthase (FAD)